MRVYMGTCVCMCICEIRGWWIVRERAGPCVTTVWVFVFRYVYMYICAEILAVIYYTCICQSIGTEEELKRKEMKL